MESDRIKWNLKFKSRSNELTKPDLFVVQHLDLFQDGTLLDLASGDGRNSIYLASKGYSVTAVDISEIALQRLKVFSEAQQVGVIIKQIDLDETEGLKQLGSFDNLLLSHFKPTQRLWNIFYELLNEKGVLMLNVFNILQHHNHGFSSQYCVEEGEYLNVSPRFEVIKYERTRVEKNYMDHYIFRKR